ncbi:hypothetical protein NYR90_11290 [Clostridioides difficile]|nr:hypothetical protein NYR90_11290 [Clostridioides difficile]
MYSIYKVKLKTKRTLEQVRNQGVDLDYSEEGLKNTLKYYNLIDGLEVIVVKFADEYTGCYINEYERFKKDWENGNCDGEASMVFSDDEVEIIEELRSK